MQTKRQPIFYICEAETCLSTPHGFLVCIPMMIQILLDSFHIQFINMKIGYVPFSLDLRLEGSQELLVGLFTHRRGDQQ